MTQKVRKITKIILNTQIFSKKNTTKMRILLQMRIF